MADDPTREYDRVIEDHGEIRRWVRQRGGRPVIVEGDCDGAGRLAVRLPGDDRQGTTRIDWDQFFARFESEGRAFACSEQPAPDEAGVECEVIDGDRVDGESDHARGEPEGERLEAQDGYRSREAERRSEARKREAEDRANADNYRDEPPHRN